MLSSTLLKSTFASEKDTVQIERKSILIKEDRESADAAVQVKKKTLKRVYFLLNEKARPWWEIDPWDPYHSFIQRWNMFMLLPLGYEAWAFPYRLALGVPSISSQMQLTPLDFAFDMIFLFDVIVSLSTSLPKGPGRAEAVTTFLGIARHFFHNIFPYYVLPAFPYWVATFFLVNHLQDPGQCGVNDKSGFVTVTWSCVLQTLTWQVYIWWATSFVRFLPRMIRLVHDFKVLESNMVRSLTISFHFHYISILTRNAAPGGYRTRASGHQIRHDNLPLRALGPRSPRAIHSLPAPFKPPRSLPAALVCELHVQTPDLTLTRPRSKLLRGESTNPDSPSREAVKMRAETIRPYSPRCWLLIELLGRPRAARAESSLPCGRPRSRRWRCSPIPHALTRRLWARAGGLHLLLYCPRDGSEPSHLGSNSPPIRPPRYYINLLSQPQRLTKAPRHQ
jgi:hypothetical protein